MKDVTDQYELHPSNEDFELVSVFDTHNRALFVVEYTRPIPRRGNGDGKAISFVGKRDLTEADYHKRSSVPRLRLRKRRNISALAEELGPDYIASGWLAADRYRGGFRDSHFWFEFRQGPITHKVAAESQAEIIAAVDKIRA